MFWLNVGNEVKDAAEPLGASPQDPHTGGRPAPGEVRHCAPVLAAVCDKTPELDA